MGELHILWTEYVGYTCLWHVCTSAIVYEIDHCTAFRPCCARHNSIQFVSMWRAEIETKS